MPLMRNKIQDRNADNPKVLRNRSVFPMEFTRKDTFKAGFLVPFFAAEVMPGDTWQMNLAYVNQMLPQVTAVKDNLVCSTWFFYVPKRLTWANFGKMLGAKDNPADHNDYIAPAMTVPTGGFKWNDLSVYLGKVPGVEIKTNSYFERAYNLIYNTYFRSSILQDEIHFDDSDTDDDYKDYELLRITKPHDYFTDCLPDVLPPGVEPLRIPLGTTAPVYGVSGKPLILRPSNNNTGEANVDPPEVDQYVTLNTLGTTVVSGSVFNAGIRQGGWNNNLSADSDLLTNKNFNVISKDNARVNTLESGLVVDLANAVSADLSALRTLIATQTILEADNRGGLRYTEILQHRYGCINPDLQLYRPQYLGGTRDYITTTPVIQSGATGSGNTVQGNMSGLAQNGCNRKVINASFGEFGVIIGLRAVTAIPQYQYGIDKMFTRFERFDEFHPEFQLISDEPVYNKELYAQDDTIIGATGEPVNDEVWGYSRRYESYRKSRSEIRGQLMSQYPQSLDTWHYAEKMTGLQNLNGTFLNDKSDVIVSRTMAVVADEGDEPYDQFIWDSCVKGIVTRSLIANPIPQTGGRIA